MKFSLGERVDCEGNVWRWIGLRLHGQVFPVTSHGDDHFTKSFLGCLLFLLRESTCKTLLTLSLLWSLRFHFEIILIFYFISFFFFSPCMCWFNFHKITSFSHSSRAASELHNSVKDFLLLQTRLINFSTSLSRVCLYGISHSTWRITDNDVALTVFSKVFCFYFFRARPRNSIFLRLVMCRESSSCSHTGLRW